LSKPNLLAAVERSELEFIIITMSITIFGILTLLVLQPGEAAHGKRESVSR
jgi:hypothetical protein